jgi:outer membrane protein OmpA-like peptidoglycan-associated protein
VYNLAMHRLPIGLGETVPRIRASARVFAVMVAVLLAALSGCGGSGGDDQHSSSATSAASMRATTGSAAPSQDQGPLGVVPMELAAGKAHVELTALSRTSDRDVTGQFRIVNDGSGELDLATALFEGGQALRSSDTASGIGLLDGIGNKLYMPLWTTGNKCLCSKLSGKVVPPGGSAQVYALFPAPPADVNRVAVVMPHTVPFQDVPITAGPVRPLESQVVDSSTTSLAAPRILPVRATVEGDQQSTDDNADDRAVRLSSDVLFALNRADLNPQASALLDGVARQVDESAASAVRVDGYTDITGNDAINQPLSERRAQTVSQRLQSLVKRHGVTFQVAGHGSRDPVASNSTDEGRRKNRRVTVTFTRPLVRQTSASSPVSSGEPYRWTKGDPAVLGSAVFTPPKASGLKVDVNSLHRDGSGVSVLVWTLRNDGGSPVDIAARFTNFRAVNASNAGTASGLELIDSGGKLRYQPLQTSDTSCLCAEYLRAGAKTRIGPGEAVTYAAIYKLPAELRTVHLQIPWSGAPGATVTDITVN